MDLLYCHDTDRFFISEQAETSRGNQVTAVKMIQAKLSTKTDAELLEMGHVAKDQKDQSGRIISAAITEELIARNPQVMAAVNAWSDDLDSEAELIEVLTAELAA